MLLYLQFTKKWVYTALIQLIMAKLLAHNAEVTELQSEHLSIIIQKS